MHTCSFQYDIACWVIWALNDAVFLMKFHLPRRTLSADQIFCKCFVYCELGPQCPCGRTLLSSRSRPPVHGSCGWPLALFVCLSLRVTISNWVIRCIGLYETTTCGVSYCCRLILLHLQLQRQRQRVFFPQWCSHVVRWCRFLGAWGAARCSSTLAGAHKRSIVLSVTVTQACLCM